MLIESVVGIGIALITLVGTMSAFSYLYRASVNNILTVQAAFLEEEGLEAARIMRDNAWSNISSQTSGASVYLQFNGTTWATSTNNTFIDGTFERKVVFTNVYRDANQNIAPTGTLDANIKKVTVSISWRDHGATTTRSLVTYLANVFNE